MNKKIDHEKAKEQQALARLRTPLKPALLQAIEDNSKYICEALKLPESTYLITSGRLLERSNVEISPNRVMFSFRDKSEAIAFYDSFNDTSISDLIEFHSTISETSDKTIPCYGIEVSFSQLATCLNASDSVALIKFKAQLQEYLRPDMNYPDKSFRSAVKKLFEDNRRLTPSEQLSFISQYFKPQENLLFDPTDLLHTQSVGEGMSIDFIYTLLVNSSFESDTDRMRCIDTLFSEGCLEDHLLDEKLLKLIDDKLLSKMNLNEIKIDNIRGKKLEIFKDAFYKYLPYDMLVDDCYNKYYVNGNDYPDDRFNTASEEIAFFETMAKHHGKTPEALIIDVIKTYGVPRYGNRSIYGRLQNEGFSENRAIALAAANVDGFFFDWLPQELQSDVSFYKDLLDSEDVNLKCYLNFPDDIQKNEEIIEKFVELFGDGSSHQVKHSGLLAMIHDNKLLSNSKIEGLLKTLKLDKSVYRSWNTESFDKIFSNKEMMSILLPKNPELSGRMSSDLVCEFIKNGKISLTALDIFTDERLEALFKHNGKLDTPNQAITDYLFNRRPDIIPSLGNEILEKPDRYSSYFEKNPELINKLFEIGRVVEIDHDTATNKLEPAIKANPGFFKLFALDKLSNKDVWFKFFLNASNEVWEKLPETIKSNGDMIDRANKTHKNTDEYERLDASLKLLEKLNKRTEVAEIRNKMDLLFPESEAISSQKFNAEVATLHEKSKTLIKDTITTSKEYQNLKQSIEKLQQYAATLPDDYRVPSEKLAKNMSESLEAFLTKMINNPQNVDSKQFNQDFKRIINYNHDENATYKDKLGEHRAHYNVILKNIGICLIPFVGLVAVLGKIAHSKITMGEYKAFFEQTRREQLTDEVHQKLDQFTQKGPGQ